MIERTVSLFSYKTMVKRKFLLNVTKAGNNQQLASLFHKLINTHTHKIYIQKVLNQYNINTF